MTTKILYLFTRTPLHVGAGASLGAIDQPVQRERHTGFPIIPGSSVKGVLRDHFSRPVSGTGLPLAEVERLFGKGGNDDNLFRSGDLSFGEARLVAFPVRSAKGAFALAVSPLTLSRLARDAGWDLKTPAPPEEMTCLAGARLVIDRAGEKGVVLEEYRYRSTGEFPHEWESKLSSLLGDAVLAGAVGRFVLLSDGDLSHFAVNACQINQHVRIDHNTGTADDGGLFNEETVPSECLMYAPITALRQESRENEAFARLEVEQLVQFGGNGTTGQGFCTIKLA
ncbi:type III-B CRISPR module RAMP protein Cmr4 [Verrucomicrobium spinosum]|uniref:type III-B CRISPR module RAMP protein Cmr4 n=1 Tax=Verrucomicrobium spinosum TaxID=2736 RepID=UPI000174439B|nr:type III-B CRISPR module RAMP protein Cmr4 [Verrucomicrobium spinosum]